MNSKMFERHSALEHQIWSMWMQELFHFGTFNDDGTWTMNADKVKEWYARMHTSWKNISELEKERFRNRFLMHTTLDIQRENPEPLLKIEDKVTVA